MESAKEYQKEHKRLVKLWEEASKEQEKAEEHEEARRLSVQNHGWKLRQSEKFEKHDITLDWGAEINEHGVIGIKCGMNRYANQTVPLEVAERWVDVRHRLELWLKGKGDFPTDRKPVK